MENVQIEIPAGLHQEGSTPPNTPFEGTWSDVPAVAEAPAAPAMTERAMWKLVGRAEHSIMIQQRVQRQRMEIRVLEAALAAQSDVMFSQAEAQFYFDTQCMYDLGVAIQANMDKAGMRKLGGRRFSVHHNCVCVGFTDGGDKACFRLNELTGEIGVELYGSGGLGGNEWYVMAMHRPGSRTQLRANYAGEFITDLLRDMAVKKY